jgi:indole-3-acetate monooxygenase
MSILAQHELEARVLASIARIRPIAEAHARDAEKAATLHRAVVAAMQEEGLFGLATPAAVGGLEAGPLVQLAAFEAMAHADPAAGWSLMIGSVTTSWLGAYLPDAAVARIFQGRMPIAAGLQVPMGTARAVKGGYEVSGRWGFGSGIRHADWIFTPATVGDPPAEGPPMIVQVAVPIDRVTIENTWDTAFLRGSGSEHYRMESVFVEEAFTCPWPLAARRRGGAVFDLPMIASVAPAHIGYALGVARRALEEIALVAPRRTKAWTGETLAAQSSFRVELGRKRAALDAARAYGREVITQVTNRVLDGKTLDPADWAAARGGPRPIAPRSRPTSPRSPSTRAARARSTRARRSTAASGTCTRPISTSPRPMTLTITRGA